MPPQILLDACVEKTVVIRDLCAGEEEGGMCLFGAQFSVWDV